jgi:hypothetical protein
MTNRSISGFSPARSSAAPLSPAFPLRPHLGDLCVTVPRSSYSALGRKASSANGEQCVWSARATAPLRLVPTPGFTTTLSINVGAPTFLILHANKKSQNPPASEGGLYKNSAPLFPFFSAVLLATSHQLARRRRATKSNYSRTSSPFARKSNYSRTYAKHGGGGPLPQNALSRNSFVFFYCVNYILNYMNNYIVGAPTFVTLRTSTNDDKPRNQPEGWPLQRRQRGGMVDRTTGLIGGDGFGQR